MPPPWPLSREVLKVEEFEAALRALASAAQLRSVRLVLPPRLSEKPAGKRRVGRAVSRLRAAQPALQVQVQLAHEDE